MQSAASAEHTSWTDDRCFSSSLPPWVCTAVIISQELLANEGVEFTHWTQEAQLTIFWAAIVMDPSNGVNPFGVAILKLSRWGWIGYGRMSRRNPMLAMLTLSCLVACQFMELWFNSWWPKWGRWSSQFSTSSSFIFQFSSITGAANDYLHSWLYYPTF